MEFSEIFHFILYASWERLMLNLPMSPIPNTELQKECWAKLIYMLILNVTNKNCQLYIHIKNKTESFKNFW